MSRDPKEPHENSQMARLIILPGSGGHPHYEMIRTSRRSKFYHQLRLVPPRRWGLNGQPTLAVGAHTNTLTRRGPNQRLLDVAIGPIKTPQAVAVVLLSFWPRAGACVLLSGPASPPKHWKWHFPAMRQPRTYVFQPLLTRRIFGVLKLQGRIVVSRWRAIIRSN